MANQHLFGKARTPAPGIGDPNSLFPDGLAVHWDPSANFQDLANRSIPDQSVASTPVQTFMSTIGQDQNVGKTGFGPILPGKMRPITDVPLPMIRHVPKAQALAPPPPKPCQPVYETTLWGTTEQVAPGPPPKYPNSVTPYGYIQGGDMMAGPNQRRLDPEDPYANPIDHQTAKAGQFVNAVHTVSHFVRSTVGSTLGKFAGSNVGAWDPSHPQPL